MSLNMFFWHWPMPSIDIMNVDYPPGEPGVSDRMVGGAIVAFCVCFVVYSMMELWFPIPPPPPAPGTAPAGPNEGAGDAPYI